MFSNVDKVVFYDLETSGLSARKHEIIQIAAVVVNSEWEEIEHFECKLQFDLARGEEEALALNSYSPKEWEDAAHPRIAVNKFSDLCRRHACVEMTSKRGKAYKVAQLAGHNVAGFDFYFLKQLYRSCDEFLPAAFQSLDTMHLATWWRALDPSAPTNSSLETLAKHFGLEPGGHDALGDVRANVAVARALVSQFQLAQKTTPASEEAGGANNERARS